MSKKQLKELLESYEKQFDEAWDRWESTKCKEAQSEANVWDWVITDLEKILGECDE